MNSDRGINFEAIVEFILSIAIGALFFLPWLSFLGKEVSGAGIFPMMRELMQDVPHGWVSYSFLLLYLIPLFALASVISFLALRSRAVRRYFVSLCDTTIFLLVVLVLVGALALSGGEDYGQTLLGMISGIGVVYWVVLGIAVAGLVFAGIAKATRKPPLKAAENSDTPSA